MNHFRTLALASAALLIAGSAIAAPPNSTINGLAAGNVPVTLGAVTDGTLKSPTHGAVDSTGAVVNPASSDNQTAIQANAGSSSSKAVGVQGVSGGVAVGVSASALPLPTGAATSANQATEITSLGTIATNSGTQATAANQTAVTGSKTGGTAATSSQLAGGVYNTSAPTLTNGQQASLQFDVNGNLKTTGTGGGGGAITAASGSYASGAFAVGSGTDGWDVTLGSKADSATCATANTAMACWRQIDADIKGAIPAGTAVIGKVGIDQTTPGTTNGVQVNAALPAGTNTLGATYSFQGSSGNSLPPAADASVAINISTATTTQLVALSAGKAIYVSAYDVIAGGTGNITFEYGTGTNCGTGTTVLTGAYPLTAQAGIAKGNGLGVVLVVPAGNALCALTSAAVQMSGSASYSQR